MLEKFFNGCSGIDCKNAGGCLFFCYAFWKWAKKNGLDLSSFDIVQYDWGDRPARYPPIEIYC